MLLITSAYPHLKRLDENGVDVGPELVARCIASWQANGFDVLSVHNAAERGVIGAGLPGVTYRFVEEELPPGARKMPSFAAVLNDLPPDEPVGIINADIFMPPCTDLAERMDRRARQATLVLHRWEVPSLERREGRHFGLGVDLFVFTPALIAPAIEGLIQRPYQLGVPWWDYALPLAAGLYSPLSLVSDPILLHHTHEQAWNDREWHVFAKVSETYLLEQVENEAADPVLAAEIGKRLRSIEEYYGDNPDRHDRNYAIADLSLHLVQALSSRNTVSLLAEMSFPATETFDAWLQPSEREARRVVEIEARRSAGAGNETSAAVKSHLGSATRPTAQDELLKFLNQPDALREFEVAPSLAIYDRVTVDSPWWSVLAAGIADLARIVSTMGKLLERRFRRWRRGQHRQRPLPPSS